MDSVDILKQWVEESHNIVFFGGAGVSTESGMPKKDFSPEAIKMLQEKSWTGNIRELRNVVERLLILGSNPVSPQDIRDYVNIG